MATQIRQEINIQNGDLAVLANGTGSTNEVVQLDTTKYNDTVTYYYEIVASLNGAGTNSTITLRRFGTSTDDASITVSSTTVTLYRSASFTAPAGQTQYITFGTAGSVTCHVKCSRIVILQNATSLTTTQTQIEIGPDSGITTTSTTSAAASPTKYWYFDSTKWDGTLTAYFEAVFKSGTSKSAATASLQVADGTGDGFTGWADVASSPVTTTATKATRVRSGAITLTSGRWYRVAFKCASSKSATTIYCAKVIIDQSALDASYSPTPTSNKQIQGTGGTGEARAQSFLTGSAYSLYAVDLYLFKSNSPTDNVYCDIASSISGAALGTSNQVACSSLKASPGAYVRFDFPTPISLSSATTYYIRVYRTGTRDTTNVPQWSVDATGGYSNGSGYDLDNGTWSAAQTWDGGFRVYASRISKMELQYLLGNVTFPGGTSLQTFLTDWDSTEWIGVTNTYYFQAEAGDNSASDVTLEKADGSGTVTNSTLTNIDNGQISPALTMPTTQNLDTKATTNNNDIAGARILVTVTLTTVAAIPNKAVVVLQSISRSNTF